MPDAVTSPTDSTPDTPPRRRWRWPVTLKIFAAILLVLGVCSGWIVWRGYRQLAAIEKIEGPFEWRGRSSWSFYLNRTVDTYPIGPMWFREQLGEERMRMFDRVTRVGLYLSSRDPELLQEIGRWSDISCLTIRPDANGRFDLFSKTPAEFRNSQLQAAKLQRTSGYGFEYLRGLTKLEILGVFISDATDRDFDWLECAPSLVALEFKHCAITDATAIPIGKLNRLKSLSLSDTLIGDEGLRSIGALKSLTDLDLSGTGVTDTGLAHLKNLTSLKHLDLDRTEITNAGLVHLQDLNLQSLYVANTKITVAGLVRIQKLKSLETLSINKSGFTTPAYLELKSLYPELSISWPED